MATASVTYEKAPIESVTLKLSGTEAHLLMNALEAMPEYPFDRVSPVAAALRRVLNPAE